MEFLVAENDTPEDSEVHLRVRNPTPLEIELTMRSSQNIWYGTHYLLRGDEISIVAVCTTGPYLKPDEAGEFLLYSNGRLMKEGAVRNEVIDALVAVL